MTGIELATAFAGLSAVASAGAASVAAVSLRGARKDSRDRTRPVVVAYFRRGPRHAGDTLYLTVKSEGATAARNLQVTFDPPMPPAEFADDGYTPNVVGPYLIRRYAKPITTLASGETMNNVYQPSGTEEKDVPNEVAVTVVYEDVHGTPYRETFPLDTAAVAAETYASPGSNDPDRRRYQALEALAWHAWE